MVGFDQLRSGINLTARILGFIIWNGRLFGQVQTTEETPLFQPSRENTFVPTYTEELLDIQKTTNKKFSFFWIRIDSLDSTECKTHDCCYKFVGLYKAMWFLIVVCRWDSWFLHMAELKSLEGMISHGTLGTILYVGTAGFLKI